MAAILLVTASLALGILSGDGPERKGANETISGIQDHQGLADGRLATNSPPQTTDLAAEAWAAYGRTIGGAVRTAERHAELQDAAPDEPTAVRAGWRDDGDWRELIAAAVWSYYGRMYPPEQVRERGADGVYALRGDMGAPDWQEAGVVPAPVRRDVPSVRDDGDWRELIEQFLTGYRAAGGPAAYERHLIEDVIPCEYGWRPYVKVNYYESRAQFDPGSWETAGGGDPADDYVVGLNVARWLSLIDDPGSTSGWPVCWHRGTP